MPRFVLQATVSENVLELRKALGSVKRMLSRDDLAAAIAESHPSKRVPNGTTVQRWEEGGEPDFHSTRIMALMAGVSFDEFALGDPKKRKAIKVSPRFRAALDEADAKRERA